MTGPASMTNEEWERQVADVWASFDQLDQAAFLARMERIVGSQPASDGSGLYERASAFDSTGDSDLAVPLYQQALERGLAEERRRPATIQLASSLRNLGRVEEAVSLLTTERERGSDPLDDAVVGFLALALADVGREREALSLALGALAPHLPRYQRSMTNYARSLGESSTQN